MRRIAMALLLIAVLVLSGCHSLVDAQPDTLDIYATFYPIYALTEALTRDIPNLELHCLVQPQDGCLRDYQLSDWDTAILASSADAVIMGGRGLESFESVLFGWDEKGPAVSAALYNLPLYNQDNSAPSDQESHLEGANPHLYMSVDGAEMTLSSIEAMLISIDPAFAERYGENLNRALDRLNELKSEIEAAKQVTAGRRVILMNEALIYVAQDYGLEVADWIDRESGEAFYDQELERCIERMNSTNADTILIERQAPQGFVETLEKANFRVVKIDILSTCTGYDGFEVYLKAQKKNLYSIMSELDSMEDDH